MSQLSVFWGNRMSPSSTPARHKN